MRFRCRLIVTPLPFLPEIAPFHTIIPPNDLMASAIKNAMIIETNLNCARTVTKKRRFLRISVTQSVVHGMFYVLGKLMHEPDNNLRYQNGDSHQ